MDAPDASDAETLTSESVVEIGDHLFGQVGQFDISDGGKNVAVNQIAVPALSVAVPFAAVVGEPPNAPLADGKFFFFLNIIVSLSANDNITESRK